MRVLLTNNSLGVRWGSELYVRDVALALRRRGHDPIAFSTVLGEVAGEIRRVGIPVVDDLDQIQAPPDVIHGHHHVETLMAALHFNGVPVVNFCHGWLPWEELPLRHPAVIRYVAVDQACRDRLVVENGIPPERVELLLNFVDMERFRPRPPLPDRARRALIFSNNAGAGGWNEVVRDACAERQMDIDVIGRDAGRSVERPEEVLPQFDLVFAKARCALEALAVGCAVVVCDFPGHGPLVTTENLAALRSANFGLRTLSRPHSVETLLAEMDRFDAADAAAVSRAVRRDAGLEASVDRLLELYRQACSEGRTPPREPDAQRAAARHLRLIAPRIKGFEQQSARAAVLEIERPAVRRALDDTRANVGGLQAELERARVAAAALEPALEEARRRLSEAEARGDALSLELERARSDAAEDAARASTRVRDLEARLAQAARERE